MQNTSKALPAWGNWLLTVIFSLFVLISSIWLGLAVWIQQPLGNIGSIVLIVLWALFSCCVLGLYFSRHLISKPADILLYIFAFLLGLFWYFSLEARQDREWNPEVAKVLSYEKQGNLVTLHNVRNFDWKADGSYTERWETRQFDLDQINGVNIVTSYWMGPQIAHTLVSFDFANQKPLTFSIEIRKEKTEDFSAIGGFFRKFELSLVASDEKDIIYTRSNTRGEQVYFFPVNMPKAEVKALFEEYLLKVDELAKQPKWYNTLTSNCTTLVFDMVQAVSKQPLPFDYRLIASGYLPNYMHDLNAIDPSLNMQTWYARAHVNPKVKSFQHMSSEQYSEIIRNGLPKPKID